MGQDNAAAAWVNAVDLAGDVDRGEIEQLRLEAAVIDHEGIVVVVFVGGLHGQAVGIAAVERDVQLNGAGAGLGGVSGDAQRDVERGVRGPGGQIDEGDMAGAVLYMGMVGVAAAVEAEGFQNAGHGGGKADNQRRDGGVVGHVQLGVHDQAVVELFEGDGPGAHAHVAAVAPPDHAGDGDVLRREALVECAHLPGERLAELRQMVVVVGRQTEAVKGGALQGPVRDLLGEGVGDVADLAGEVVYGLVSLREALVDVGKGGVEIIHHNAV